MNVKKENENPYFSLNFAAVFLAFFLTPGLLLTGSNLLTTDRSLTALYGASGNFMRQHQFQLIPPSEEEASIAIRNTLFRDAPSFRDGIVKHPDLYVDYIGVSAAISLPNPLKVIKFMSLPFLLILSKVRRIQHHKFILIGTAMVALCIPLPTWLVLFTRMHYIDIGGFSYISQSIGITPSQD